MDDDKKCFWNCWFFCEANGYVSMHYLSLPSQTWIKSRSRVNEEGEELSTFEMPYEIDDKTELIVKVEMPRIP